MSRTLSHRDFPRVISQAKGTPASKSNADTTKPIMKEFEMAPRAVFNKVVWFKTFWIVGALIKTPMMGGIRIIAMKMMIAER